MTILFFQGLSSNFAAQVSDNYSGRQILSTGGNGNPGGNFYRGGAQSIIPVASTPDIVSNGLPGYQQIQLSQLAAGAAFQAMQIPSSGFPSGGFVDFPNGTFAPINFGVALIPLAWQAWAATNGWAQYTGT